MRPLWNAYQGLAIVAFGDFRKFRFRQADGYRTLIILILLVALAGNSCSYISRKEATAPVAIPSPTAQRSLPKQIGLINDFADVFNPTEEKRLNQLVTELASVNVDFPIVTIDTTNGEPLFDYSLALARDWRPGGLSKRGLLLVLAIKDRQWRLQVSEALRSSLPDDVCHDLARPSEDFYKQGKYADGVESYVRALAERLRASQ